jgi:hypothetical protein
MHKIQTLGVALVFFISCAATAQATTLVSYSFTLGPGIGQNPDQFYIMVLPGHYDGVNLTSFPLFDQLTVASLVQGQTYTIASNADDPQFSEAAKTLSAALRAPYNTSTLTGAGYIGIEWIGIMDGTPTHFIGDFFSPPPGNLPFFTGWFMGHFYSQPSVFEQADIPPANVQSFNLRVDNLVITTDPSSGQPTLDALSYTLFVDGVAPAAVPEPTTMLLLGSGLLGLWGARKKFKK